MFNEGILFSSEAPGRLSAAAFSYFHLPPQGSSETQPAGRGTRVEGSVPDFWQHAGPFESTTGPTRFEGLPRHAP